MKEILKNSLILICLFLLYTACEKDDGPKYTIQLYDKPLSVIKANIEGKWQLHYGKGGFCATCIHQWGNDDYWDFDFSNGANSIKASDEPLKANTTIEWRKSISQYTIATNLKTDTTYVMYLYDKKGYIIDGIYNDTLTIHDFGSDPVFYYFTKK